MLEPYTKLKQDLNIREIKLKELDSRIKELEKFRSLVNNIKESHYFPNQQTITSTTLPKTETTTITTVDCISGQTIFKEQDEVDSNENKLKILTQDEKNKSFNLKKQSVFKIFGSKSNLDKEFAETPDSENCNFLMVSERQLASRRASETSIRRSINSEIVPSVKKTQKEAIFALDSVVRTGSGDRFGVSYDEEIKKKLFTKFSELG